MFTELKVIPLFDQLKKISDIATGLDWFIKEFTAITSNASLEICKVLNHLNTCHKVDTIAMGVQVFRNGIKGFVVPFVSEMIKFKNLLIWLKENAPNLEAAYMSTLDKLITDVSDIINFFPKSENKDEETNKSEKLVLENNVENK